MRQRPGLKKPHAQRKEAKSVAQPIAKSGQDMKDNGRLGDHRAPVFLSLENDIRIIFWGTVIIFHHVNWNQSHHFDAGTAYRGSSGIRAKRRAWTIYREGLSSRTHSPAFYILQCLPLATPNGRLMSKTEGQPSGIQRRAETSLGKGRANGGYPAPHPL